MEGKEQNGKVELSHLAILKSMFHITSRDIFEIDAYSNFGQQGMAFSKGYDSPFDSYNSHTPSFISSLEVAKERDRFVIDVHSNVGQSKI